MPMNNITSLIKKMETELRELIVKEHIENPTMIGIRTGGVWIAEKLHTMMDLPEPLSTLNINFYRDDFSRAHLNPEVGPSDIKINIKDRNIILIDDVLHTGRTIRAALNEIFDYDRPARVLLAVLIDRGGRELPIAPDVLGETITLDKDKDIKLRGPDPLRLEIK